MPIIHGTLFFFILQIHTLTNNIVQFRLFSIIVEQNTDLSRRAYRLMAQPIIIFCVLLVLRNVHTWVHS